MYFSLIFHLFHYTGFAVGFRLPGFNSYSSFGTVTDTCAQPIAHSDSYQDVLSDPLRGCEVRTQRFRDTKQSVQRLVRMPACRQRARKAARHLAYSVDLLGPQRAEDPAEERGRFDRSPLVEPQLGQLVERARFLAGESRGGAGGGQTVELACGIAPAAEVDLGDAEVDLGRESRCHDSGLAVERDRPAPVGFRERGSPTLYSSVPRLLMASACEMSSPLAAVARAMAS